MQQENPPDKLAYFQDQLLQLLWRGGTPEDIRLALLADPQLAAFHAYISSMDAHMIEIAGELVHKWGVTGKPS